MDELQEMYPNIDISKQVSLLGTLNQIYNETKTQFVIIIDEWDVLFRDCKDTKIQNEYLDLLRSLFKSPYSNEFIALAYLTGILPIKRTTTQSALNNFDEYTMITPGPLARFIGFNEDEVQALCQKYNMDYTKVKHWYDGYTLTKYHVYNPRAVVSVMNYGVFQSYWTKTSSYESINNLIQMNFDGLKEAVIDMLGGNKVEVNTNSFQNDMESFRDKDDVLTALIHLGYLAYDSTWNSVFIPNEEIRQEFVIALKEDKWNELIEFEKESDTIFEATLEMDNETVASGIERIHNRFSSNFTYHNENALSNILTLAYLSTLKYYFKPQRELPTGRGFADFVYIPKPQYKEYYPALVVELKWNQSVESAMDQIHAKKYFESIEDYTDHLLLVGINYDKKTKVHTCKIEHA